MISLTFSLVLEFFCLFLKAIAPCCLLLVTTHQLCCLCGSFLSSKKLEGKFNPIMCSCYSGVASRWRQTTSSYILLICVTTFMKEFT